MLKSISVWAFQEKRPLQECFRIAKNFGFAGVEVAVAQDGPLTPHSTIDDCRRIIEQAQEAGIQLAALASGMGWQTPIIAQDAQVRRRGIEIVAGSLRVAQRLGLDTILMVPGTVGPRAETSKGAPYELAWQLALAAMGELKPVAEAAGVAIGVENVWNKFLLSPLEMRDFVDKCASPQIGCYFDVGNVLLNGYPEQWIEILGPRIKKVHFKDFQRDAGTLAGFCDLLEGDVNFPAVMAALRGIGYDGPVTVESFDCEDDLPKISAAMDKILQM